MFLSKRSNGLYYIFYNQQNGKMKKTRVQPALPWEVPGSRWEGLSRKVI
jgi:hypothetical protein